MNFESGVIIPIPQLKLNDPGLVGMNAIIVLAFEGSSLRTPNPGASKMRPHPAASLASMRHSTATSRRSSSRAISGCAKVS